MSSKLPLIGLPSRPIEPSDHFTATEGVWSDYARAIEAGGGAPVIFPLTKDLRVIREIYNVVQGIVLPGGGDINPKRYGEVAHSTVSSVSDERDEVEFALAQWAYEDKKPLLGICRGLQVMNCALGGTLHQDIESLIPESIPHRDTRSNDAWKALRHEMTIDPSSRLASLVGKTSLVTNSLHHQSLNKISPQLKVVSSSSDGVVEAAEVPGASFYVGVQCHPEMIFRTDAHWLNLFQAFVQEASLFEMRKN